MNQMCLAYIVRATVNTIRYEEREREKEKIIGLSHMCDMSILAIKKCMVGYWQNRNEGKKEVKIKYLKRKVSCACDNWDIDLGNYSNSFALRNRTTEQYFVISSRYRQGPEFACSTDVSRSFDFF